MRRFSILVFAFFAVAPAFGYVVNDLGDTVDATPGDNICATAGAVCTLRAAIMEANAHAGADTITFSVAGSIAPGTALPAITERVDIDATTAPGYAGAPVVDLDGQGGMVTYGLDFAAGSSSSTVAGLRIHGFGNAAVRIASDTVQVRRNYIGPIGAGTANQTGIELAGTGSTIGGANGDGNVISGNQGNGIVVTGSGHSIRDNFIGTNAAGTAALANSADGISIQGANNVTVGSSLANEWNVISGNSAVGVDIEGGTGNIVAGNFIGTDAAGANAVGNNAGVRVTSAGNTVGTTAARNVVSGNSSEGIVVGSASGVIVRNNNVGLDLAGTTGIGNGGEGIRVTNSSNIDVGGTAAGEGNIASFNGSDGISVAESTDIRIHGNIAGLDAAGTSILGNGFAGIALSAASNTTVGAVGAGRNIISGNSFGGIVSGFGTNNVFEGNRVGTDMSGAVALGNLGTGILIGSSDGDIVRSNVVSANGGHGIEATMGSTNVVMHSNIIGLSADLSTALGNTGDGVNVCDSAANITVGSVVLGGNTIANNGANGIGVEPTALLNNTWAANSIYDNTRLGIDLHVDGVTENDPNDADPGANNLQNFPTLVSAVTSGSGSQIRGTINTNANTSITVHVYSSPAADGSGNGEGRTYLGATTFMTDGSGNANWTINGAASAVGHVASATATGPDGTSEFSDVMTVNAVPAVQFSQATYTIAENGGSATITVTRTGDLNAISTVDYATSNNTAAAGSDYTTSSGTLTFNPTVASLDFTVPVINDGLDEPDETVNLTLSNPGAATLGAQSTALLTITDDDPTPTLSIDDVTLAEGNGGTTNFVFTISLSAVSGQQVQVNYTTTNGSATSGSDYTTTSSTATIPAGSPSVQVTVPVLGDNVFEPDETFTVDLSAPVNATIADNQGLGTITNDDAQPAITINDVTLAEGNAGTTNFVFTVTLSNPSASAITVDYATADGTATAPSDYIAIPTTTLTFPALSTSQQITVVVNGDLLVEPTETFFVNLTNPGGATIADNQGLGTITNDEGVPTITINDVTLAEGNAGTTDFIFTITMSAQSATPVTVSYATADGTATAGSDYTAASAVATLAPNTTTTSVTIAVAGDTTIETDETFFVNLSAPSGATIADNQGLGTITNDDLAADLGVTKTANVTSFTPGQQITFTITVTNAGPGSAASTTVTDVLPAGTTFVSATPSVGSCSGTTTVTCSLGTLANGASATISLIVTASGSTAITNTATAVTTSFDPTTTNNSGSVTIAAASTAAIPTLSTWMLIALGAALAMLALKKM